MSEKGKIAREYFMNGYNCSQSVLGAFAQDLGLDFDTAMRISSSFGGGMGRLREVCGAFSGIAMAIGMKYGYSDPKANEKKKELYIKVQDYAKDFSNENGSIICKELLGLSLPSSPTPDKRTQVYYKKRPCADLVEYAADLLAKEFEE